MNSAHLFIDVQCSSKAKKKIDLAPLLERHFNVCGAKIWHYSIIPPLLQMLLVIIFSK